VATRSGFAYAWANFRVTGKLLREDKDFAERYAGRNVASALAYLIG